LAVDEGIDQPSLAFLEVAKRPFKALPPGEGVLLATSPDIEDDNPEQAKPAGCGPRSLSVGLDLTLWTDYSLLGNRTFSTRPLPS
jgi:hypothetical protein